MVRGIMIAAAALALALASAFALAGCSGNRDSADYRADEDFMASLSKGLEQRFALADEMEKDGTSSESLAKAVQAELDAVGKYRDLKFESANLKAAATAYIDVLDEQLEAARLYDGDPEGYERMWKPAYAAREVLLYQFVSDWGLTVSQRHAATLKGLAAKGKSEQVKATREEKLDSLASSIELGFVEDYAVKGEAVVANDTGYDFNSIGFDVEFFDESGVKTSTQHMSATHWLDGETIELSCYVPDGTLPASYKVIVSSYQIGE